MEASAPISTRIEIDPDFQSLIPPLSTEERTQLEANLIADGCRDPLVLWGTILVDGHNRYEICARLGIDFDVVQREFTDREDAIQWIIRNQFGRRNLSAFVRAELALRAQESIAKQAKANQGTRTDIPQNSAECIKPIETRQEIAKLAGVSHDTISRVQKIQETASEETKADLRSGAISINEAFLQVTGKAKTAHVSNNSGENEWYTPVEFIGAAREVMGSIDTDPASSAIANKTVKASRFFTKEDDGLTKKWAGNVWMNPPYAQPLIANFSRAVVEKFLSGEITQAAVLVNNATETAWCQEMLKESYAVCFPAARVRFLDQQGNPGAPLQGQAVIYFGDEADKFCQVFSKFGACFASVELCD